MSQDAPSSGQVICPHCRRLITFPSITAGAREQCPHCDGEFTVSDKLLAQGKTDEADEEEYGLRIDTSGRAIQGGPGLLQAHSALGDDVLSDVSRPEKSRPKVDAEQEEQEPAPTWRPMEAPPLWLFFKGTFSFPFHVKSKGCLIVLVLLSFTLFTLAKTTFYYGAITGVDAWVYSLVSGAVAGVLCIVWFITLSAYGVAVIRDASEGMDRFVSWPKGWFTEWLEEACHVFVNLFFAGAPAFIVLWLVPHPAKITAPAVFLSELILFPVFLLSSLHSDTTTMPYSRSVWLSLGYAWHAWLLFYSLTLLTGETMIYLWIVNPYKEFWTEISVISILLPIFWLVYARLLGRLAWFCLGRFEEGISIRRSKFRGAADE